MDEKENRNYINSKIHPIFERLVIDLLLNKPDDPVDYMLEWLKDKGQQFRANVINVNQTTNLQALVTYYHHSKEIIKETNKE